MFGFVFKASGTCAFLSTAVPVRLGILLIGGVDGMLGTNGYGSLFCHFFNETSCYMRGFLVYLCRLMLHAASVFCRHIRLEAHLE